MEIGNMGYNVNAYRGEGMDNNRKTEQTIDYSSFDIRVGGVEGNVIGSGMWNTADGKSYEISASYADNYSEAYPIIKVSVRTPQGVNERYINIKSVDPRNAKDEEIFALCAYEDATRQGADDMASIYQMLMNHVENDKDYKPSGSLEESHEVRRDWTEMVHSAVDGCMGSDMYRQAMDGRKILGLFDSHIDKYFNPDKAKESEDGEKEIEESTTDTDIIVKADGSRVLVVTTSIAGMSISRSLKISEPTKTPNEDREVNETEEKDQDVRSGNKGAGDFTAGSEWNDTHAGGV